MTEAAAIVLGSRDWLLPAVAIVLLALLLVWWAYRHARGLGGIGLLARSLKIAGVMILALCLIEPLWSGVRARPGANLFLIVADNSQSLQVRDPGERQMRGEKLRDRLTKEKSPWQTRLSQDFDVRRYLLDSRLQNISHFGDLNFEGTATALGTSLQRLGQRYQGRPLAGILLLTDGNATDLEETALDLNGLPPIYPIVVGNTNAPQDLAIESVAVSQTSFEDAPVTIRATVEAIGYDPETDIVARLFDENDQLVEQDVQTTGADDAPIAFRFHVRPRRPGISFYRLQISVQGEEEQFEEPERSSEATLANNTRLITVDRGQGPHRILYVSGRPNWEFKFLRRAIEEDQQLDLVGLIRIAKREPKFEFRGHLDESTNPLFRGFQTEADAETEQYDEAVLVRLNTKDAAELQGGFPKTETELFAFDAVILDDLEVEFFTHDQMRLLQRFVSQRGGGLLMLGGQESFAQGEYHRTPVGEMLPVYLDRAPSVQGPRLYRLSLTRDGWLQPWVRLRSNEEDERKRLEQMPAFHILNAVRSIKPGAIVLATVADPGGTKSPALIVQQFGRGRCASLTVGDFWRWRLKQKDREARQDLDKAWRQMTRWLVADVPERIEVDTRSQPEVASEALQLNVRVRTPEFEPLDHAVVRVRITPPSGQEIPLTAEPSLDEAGLFQTVYVPRKQGAHRALVEVDDGEGNEVGKVETGWASDPAAKEFRSIRPNPDLLRRIAEETGGEIVQIDDLETFVATLPNRKAP